MASALINNASQIYFDSVLGMEEEGMDMVTPPTRQDRGYAVQICILLKGAPDLELQESKEFPPLKILTAKTVGTYVAKNKNITVDVDEPVGDGPVVKKKAASKRRPTPTVGEPVAKKKKKTTVEKAAPSDKDLALVSGAQDVEPISTLPAVTPRAPRRRAPKRKLILPIGSMLRNNQMWEMLLRKIGRQHLLMTHDVRLVEPKDYRVAVDKALRADQEWKAVVEERQLKRHAFQQKDQRPPKKPYKNQQRSQEQKPQEQKTLVVQPISAVSAVGNKPQCPKCQKNHHVYVERDRMFVIDVDCQDMLLRTVLWLGTRSHRKPERSSTRSTQHSNGSNFAFLD
ncbi:hypothetical protein F511_16861 [Dorcoceras hygrometricum]|uniref:Uncharacterized protein n=1 Tax=Dorcoceras hygrometricum TaxID=472368 RepID=A0A2Z7CEB9_9LAMI|nr:hypothetical protein F511_16861 [Dorcoceras hygrometricum]